MSRPESPPELPPEPQVFAEPWQAQLFAVTVRLNEAGHFAWPQWAELFGAELKARAAAGLPAGDADEESGYWQAWLAALERLLAERGLAAAPELDRLEAAWAEAYRTTPHGRPVALE